MRKNKEKKPKTKKLKKDKKLGKKKKVFTIFLIIIDLLAVILLFIFYGPFSAFRNYYITTAMKTMTHKYLAYTFYSEEIIEEVLANNTIIEVEDDTDTSQIVFSENADTGVYESYYEEQILKKDEGNDLYKIIEIEGKTWEGHLVVIYDPSKIELVRAKNLSGGGQRASSIAKSYDAVIAINGGGFKRSGKSIKPKGNYIEDGKILYNSGTKSKLIGFNEDNVLMLLNTTAKDALNKGMTDGVSFGPFLIVNGKASTFKGDGGYGKRSRTAIAQRQDGIVLFAVIDGKTLGNGISMPDLTDIFIKYKAYNAANLDGGGSSTLVINNKVINNPAGWNYRAERYIADAFIVKK